MPDFISMLGEKGIEYLELHFTDLYSRLRMVSIPRDEITAEDLERGFPKLDGSSVEGFGRIDDSDFNLKPDIDTFIVLPWNTEYGRIGRVYSYIYKTFGEEPLETDPRRVAYNLLKHLDGMGLKVYIGVEAEFYLFSRVEIDVNAPYSGLSYYLESPSAPWRSDGYPTELKKGYYASKHIDYIYEYRYELGKILRDSFGLRFTALHHEVGAASQMEIDILHDDPLRTADNYVTLKYVAREVANKYGFYVTFMPKPIYGDNGSGLHMHISLWRGDRNIFYDPDDGYAELSQEARYFIGGLIEHGRSLSAIVSPTVNSYRRLVPGYEAPIYLAWSRANRSAAIRIPVYRRGDSMARRIEYRPPDPLANPYLAFPAVIMAGLDGLRRKIDPGDPVDTDLYHLTKGDRVRLGIRELPRDLFEALEELRSDYEYLKPVFNDTLIETYIELKMEEYRELSLYPSPVEHKKYFSI